MTEAALFLPGTGQKESLTACCPTTERQRYYFCPYHHQTYSQSTAACSSGAPERQKPPRTPRRPQIRELVLQSLSLTLVSKSTRKWCLCVGGVGNETKVNAVVLSLKSGTRAARAKLPVWFLVVTRRAATPSGRSLRSGRRRRQGSRPATARQGTAAGQALARLPAPPLPPALPSPPSPAARAEQPAAGRRDTAGQGCEPGAGRGAAGRSRLGKGPSPPPAPATLSLPPQLAPRRGGSEGARSRTRCPERPLTERCPRAPRPLPRRYLAPVWRGPVPRGSGCPGSGPGGGRRARPPRGGWRCRAGGGRPCRWRWWGSPWRGDGVLTAGGRRGRAGQRTPRGRRPRSTTCANFGARPRLHLKGPRRRRRGWARPAGRERSRPAQPRPRGSAADPTPTPRRARGRGRPAGRRAGPGSADAGPPRPRPPSVGGAASPQRLPPPAAASAPRTLRRLLVLPRDGAAGRQASQTAARRRPVRGPRGLLGLEAMRGASWRPPRGAVGARVSSLPLEPGRLGRGSPLVSGRPVATCTPSRTSPRFGVLVAFCESSSLYGDVLPGFLLSSSFASLLPFTKQHENHESRQSLTLKSSRIRGY